MAEKMRRRKLEPMSVGQGAAGLAAKAAQEVNPEEFDEKLSPEEQQKIDDLSPEETAQIIETELMPLDPDDGGYDAAEGVFRPESEHWRKLAKDGSLKERTLVPVHSQEEMKALEDQYILDPESYVTETLEGSTLCWYPDNRTMLLFLKNIVPASVQNEAWDGLEKMVFKDPTRSETKGAIEFNGPSATVRAGELLFGYMDSGWIRMATATLEQQAEYEKLRPILQKLNAQFARTLPRHFAEQNRLIPAPFRQYGTALSTISFLKSCPSAVHKDAGNGLSLTVMTTVGKDSSGGPFCVLEYGLKIPVKPGDVLIAATAREWHVNLTPVQGTKYSIIGYYRRGLASPKRLEEWTKKRK